jgi:hypothetical protein
MKHLAFYYAISFAVVGCLMLLVNLSTIVEMFANNFDPFNTAVLSAAILLPFAISGLSWRDWKDIQRKKDIPEEDGR